jgi:hypothetical protein
MTAPLIDHMTRARRSLSVGPASGNLLAAVHAIFTDTGAPIRGQLWEREAERSTIFEKEVCEVVTEGVDSPRVRRHRWARVERGRAWSYGHLVLVREYPRDVCAWCGEEREVSA